MNNNRFNSKQYLDSFYSKISEITAQQSDVYIVNAGRMNHGKSSLFNSFLGRDEFAAKDVRTTIENKEVLWKDNVVLIDTPGLDATDADDEAAFAAYKKASLILFVHTVKIGELHEQELAEIEKIANMFERSYFWNHFALVLSFMESVDDDLETIKAESIRSIKEKFPEAEFKVFAVSNSRYKKGIAENKQGLIKKSGIVELLEYIEGQLPRWKEDIRDLSNQRINRLREEAIRELKVLKLNKVTCLNDKENENKNVIQKTREVFQNMCRALDSMYEAIDERKSEIDKIKSKVKKLKEQWNKEKY